MPIYQAQSKGKMCIGNKKVKAAYQGAVKVYSSGNIVTYHVDMGVIYREEVDEGASCLSPKTFTPSKSGWTFVGWRTDSIANGSVISSKVMGDDPITLYAVFRQTVTLTYYNGSTTASSTSEYKYYNNGNTINPSFSITPASLNGWTFRGWATSSAAAAGIDCSSISNTTFADSTTIYAAYSQTITLYYNGNGNTSGSTAAQTSTRYFNSGNYYNPSFMISSNGFSKTNYTFSKWALGSTSGTQYAAGAVVTLSASTTMYAIWTPVAITSSVKANGTANNSPNIVYAFYDTKIDFTLIKTATFTIKYYYYDPVSDWNDDQKYYYNTYQAIVGVSTNKSSFAKSSKYIYGQYSYDTTQSGTTTITLDVSDLTGNYYVGAGTKGYNSYNDENTKLEKPKEQTYYVEITKVVFS